MKTTPVNLGHNAGVLRAITCREDGWYIIPTRARAQGAKRDLERCSNIHDEVNDEPSSSSSSRKQVTALALPRNIGSTASTATASDGENVFILGVHEEAPTGKDTAGAVEINAYRGQPVV